MDTLRRLFIAIQLWLWTTFVCALFDPAFVTAVRPTDSLFHQWAWMFDFLYHSLDWLTAPVQSLTQMTGWYNTADGNEIFPITTAADLAAWLQGIGLPAEGIHTQYPGAIIWWVPLASIMYTMLFGTALACYEPFRNSAWNLIVEYLFQRKKAKLYAQALDQRNADLARLNHQYHSLARETDTLKDTVITDELTKVFNKRFFLSRLAQEFETCRRQQRPFAVMMIDIDYFKRLNDTYGHLVGDKVLQAVAETIKRFSPGQCFPCRYGGEEFSIIMPNKTVENAMALAQTLQENVQNLKFTDIDPNLKVTISQGICAVDFTSAEAKAIQQYDAILELADQELYRSKMEGRNRFFARTVPAIKTPGSQG